jgi:hypothetical protein
VVVLGFLGVRYASRFMTFTLINKEVFFYFLPVISPFVFMAYITVVAAYHQRASTRRPILPLLVLTLALSAYDLYVKWVFFHSNSQLLGIFDSLTDFLTYVGLPSISSLSLILLACWGYKYTNRVLKILCIASISLMALFSVVDFSFWWGTDLHPERLGQDFGLFFISIFLISRVARRTHNVIASPESPNEDEPEKA